VKKINAYKAESTRTRYYTAKNVFVTTLPILLLPLKEKLLNSSKVTIIPRNKSAASIIIREII